MRFVLSGVVLGEVLPETVDIRVRQAETVVVVVQERLRLASYEVRVVVSAVVLLTERHVMDRHQLVMRLYYGSSG